MPRRLPDPRQPGKILHGTENLLRQRMFTGALNYEDVTDHDGLCDDVALQTTCETDTCLAGSSMPGRLEREVPPEWARAAHRNLPDVFVVGFRKTSKVFVLNFDATDKWVHGNQEGRFSQLLLLLAAVCVLRQSSAGGVSAAGELRRCPLCTGGSKLLARRLREAWLGVRIVPRVDSRFWRPRILSRCERNRVDHIVGLAQNRHLGMLAERGWRGRRSGAPAKKKRRSAGFYATKTWHRGRQVLARRGYGTQGLNPRFVMTSIDDSDIRGLYENFYCARGERGNRIKEQEVHLFRDRASCLRW